MSRHDVGGIDGRRTLYASVSCAGGERAVECGHTGYRYRLEGGRHIDQARA